MSCPIATKHVLLPSVDECGGRSHKKEITVDKDYFLYKRETFENK